MRVERGVRLGVDYNSRSRVRHVLGRDGWLLARKRDTEMVRTRPEIQLCDRLANFRSIVSHSTHRSLQT